MSSVYKKAETAFDDHFSGMGMSGSEVAEILFQYIDHVGDGIPYRPFGKWLGEAYRFDTEPERNTDETS